MRLRALEKQVRRILAGLDVPDPFDLRAFCASVAAARGRDLHLHQLPAAGVDGTACGLWLSTDKADHVFYAASTGWLHQQHIILHEIGHILCDHVAPAPEPPVGATAGATTGDGLEDVTALLLPDLDPATVARVLRRSSYSAPQEQVAEMIATMLNTAASTAARPTAADPSLDNLYDALAEPFLVERRGR
ncbi:hypothetical protein [Dactylosporangium sp. NPDC000521]|uniref:hypothetical protein n=1 Tax=Dactylosporangium sp. NPDC000521 TaxID=3363975 RepID=UPI0036B682E5